MSDNPSRTGEMALFFLEKNLFDNSPDCREAVLDNFKIVTAAYRAAEAELVNVKEERDMAFRVAENHRAREKDAVRIGCENITRAEAAEQALAVEKEESSKARIADSLSEARRRYDGACEIAAKWAHQAGESRERAEKAEAEVERLKTLIREVKI